MAHTSIKLYRRESDGQLAYQSTFKDSYCKCSVVFQEVQSEPVNDNSFFYRVDLLNESDSIIASKIVEADETFRLPV